MSFFSSKATIKPVHEYLTSVGSGNTHNNFVSDYKNSQRAFQTLTSVGTGNTHNSFKSSSFQYLTSTPISTTISITEVAPAIDDLNSNYPFEYFELSTQEAPYDICSGPNNTIWFTLPVTSSVGFISTITGAVTTYSTTIALYDIVEGSDGNLWSSGFGIVNTFNGATLHVTAKITPTGQITYSNSYITPYTEGPGLAPEVLGPDGNVWGLGPNASGELSLVSIDTNAVIQAQYELPQRQNLDFIDFADVCLGPDGNFWVLTTSAPVSGTPLYHTQLTKITLSGATTVFTVLSTTFPNVNADSSRYITAGRNNNLYYTFSDYYLQSGNPRSKSILGIFNIPSASSTVFQYSGTADITPGALDRGICLGPDGLIWTTRVSKNELFVFDSRWTPFLNPLDAEYCSYSEYPISPSGTPNAYPDTQGPLILGPDGNLWFSFISETNGGGLIRYEPPKLSLYSASNGAFPFPFFSSPLLINSGPDGNLWFYDGTYLSSWNTSAVQETTLSVPPASASSGSYPNFVAGMCLGADNNFYLPTYYDSPIGVGASGAVYQISIGGAYTAFPMPAFNYSPALNGLCVGSDNNLWMGISSQSNSHALIAKMTTSGTFTAYQIPSVFAGTNIDLCLGSDNNVWFTEITVQNNIPSTGKIGTITTSGTITEYSVPIYLGNPLAICPGASGNLYSLVVQFDGTPYIVELNTSGTFLNTWILATSGDGVNGFITTGADGNIWCTYGVLVQLNVKTGQLTYFSNDNFIYTGDGGYAGIPFTFTSLCAGPDGNIWFTYNDLPGLHTTYNIGKYDLINFPINKIIETSPSVDQVSISNVNTLIFNEFTPSTDITIVTQNISFDEFSPSTDLVVPGQLIIFDEESPSIDELFTDPLPVQEVSPSDDELSFNVNQEVDEEAPSTDTLQFNLTLKLSDFAPTTDTLTSGETTTLQFNEFAPSNDFVFSGNVINETFTVRLVVLAQDNQTFTTKIQVDAAINETYTSNINVIGFTLSPNTSISDPSNQYEPTIISMGSTVVSNPSTAPISTTNLDTYISINSGLITSTPFCDLFNFNCTLDYSGGRWSMISTSPIGALGGEISVFGLVGFITAAGQIANNSSNGWITSGIFGSRNLHKQLYLLLYGSIYNPLLTNQTLTLPNSSYWGTVKDAALAIAALAGVNVQWLAIDMPLNNFNLEPSSTAYEAINSLAARVGATLRWNGNAGYLVWYPDQGMGAFAIPGCDLFGSGGLQYQNLLDLETGISGSTTVSGFGGGPNPGINLIPAPGNNNSMAPGQGTIPNNNIGAPGQPAVTQVAKITKTLTSSDPSLVFDLPFDYDEVFLQVLVPTGEASNGNQYTTSDPTKWTLLKQNFAGQYVNSRDVGGLLVPQIAVDYTLLPSTNSAVSNNNFALSIACTHKTTSAGQLQQAFQQQTAENQANQAIALGLTQETFRFIKLQEVQSNSIFFGAVPLPGMYFSGSVGNFSIPNNGPSIIESISFSYPGLITVNSATYARVNFIQPYTNISTGN